ncbi:MAG: cation diffusion facilitator family transporter [Candidatus Marinimicrobia bacterium]|nr:cation diffusion facilitator family transporter [Candidatus Neomarinimicrobiota bacterium]
MSNRLSAVSAGGWSLGGFCARRWLPRGLAPADTAGRQRLGEIEGIIGLVLSVVLSLLKLALGLLAGSLALLADAANNLADIGSSLLVIWGFRVARRPRDRQHPYGYGRIEPLVAFILALILLAVAIEVLRAGLGRLAAPKTLQVTGWMLVVIGATVGAKTLMAWLAFSLARVTHSQVLRTEAWNHGFDVLSTSLVFLGLLGARQGWHQLDGWAAIGVAACIAYTGWRQAGEAGHVLIGAAPDPTELKRVMQLATQVPEVFSAHDVVIHAYGDLKLISLHIEVDARQDALAAHALAEQVEEAVAAATNARTVVHADPVDHTHPDYAEAATALRHLVVNAPYLGGFHDLRLEGTKPNLKLQADLVGGEHLLPAEFAERIAQAHAQLARTLPFVRAFDLGLETPYAGDREIRRHFERDPPLSTGR